MVGEEDAVYHAIFFGFVGSHPVVAVGVSFDAFERHSGVVGDDLVEFGFVFEDFAGGDFDV